VLAKTMPKLVLLGLVFLVLSACVSELGTPFQLQGGGTTVFREGLRITFTEIREDSRCPRDAVCVWPGRARIALEVESDGASPFEVELSTLSNESSAEVGGFLIELRAVDPYPELNKPPPAFGERSATLVVTRVMQDRAAIQTSR
jgi:hypothetical protein